MIATRDFDIAAKPRALRAERAWVPQTKSDGYCWGQANRAPKYSWSQTLAERFGTAALVLVGSGLVIAALTPSGQDCAGGDAYVRDP